MATITTAAWRAVLRSPDEEYRASTPLELLFDLCFVVAISRVAAELHHALVERHFADGIVGYVTVFGAIWWAWMNFTWFASAHDADDVPYRLLTFLQMAGALVMAAGVHDAMIDLDFTTITVGYVMMRTALVVQWLRVARDQPATRRRALRYAAGIGIVQLLWVARLPLPDSTALPVWAGLMLCELAVPVWAERVDGGPWYHAEHITERYGLFTIIVLGEAILSATVSIQEAITTAGLSAEMLAIAVGALIVAFAAWWMYFAGVSTQRFRRDRDAFLWGYGHFPVFSGLAAFGAGVQVAVDSEVGAVNEAGEPVDVSTRLGALAVTIPVAVALLGMAAIALLTGRVVERSSVVYMTLTAAAVVVLGLLVSAPVAVLATGLMLAAVTCYRIASPPRCAGTAEVQA